MRFGHENSDYLQLHKDMVSTLSPLSSLKMQMGKINKEALSKFIKIAVSLFSEVIFLTDKVAAIKAKSSPSNRTLAKKATSIGTERVQ